jgi:hypothetical protein
MNCSPAGSKARVARIRCQKIAALETAVTMIDLSGDPNVDFIMPQFFDAKDDVCLNTESPVYERINVWATEIKEHPCTQIFS